MIEKIKRKFKIAIELMEFKIKKLKTRPQPKADIYTKTFLDAIKNEIEEQKKI